MHVLFRCPDARLQGVRDVFLDTSLSAVMPNSRSQFSRMAPTEFLDLLITRDSTSRVLASYVHDIFAIIESVPLLVLQDDAALHSLPVTST